MSRILHPPYLTPQPFSDNITVMPPTKLVEPVYRQFGAKVEAMRAVMAITQADLAKKVKLTRASIANIEAGKQRILLADVEKFAEALGMSPRSLMKGIWG